MNIIELQQVANTIRQRIITMIAAAKTGHPGGSLSLVEILTVLYFDAMNIRPQEPRWAERDRFILSKGHAAPVLYAILAERGFFPAQVLLTLRQFGSILQGHPDMKSTPGIDMSTGSLGQGLSAANGMALAAKLDGSTFHTYVVLGDGELEEGQIWEAAMTAAHHQLDNITVFVDNNRLQLDGASADIKGLRRIADKFRAFDWHVLEIDGHDIAAIQQAVTAARAVKGMPTVIVADTVKGKGVSFMENNVEWHGVAPNAEETQRALAELQGGDGK